MNRFSLIVFGFGLLSMALGQRTEERLPTFIAAEYQLSKALESGKKVPTLFDSAGKSANIPTGKQLLWLIPTDYAESAQDPIRIEGLDSQPLPNRGNIAIQFLAATKIKQNIIFFENQMSKKISTLDLQKVTKRFSGFNIFFDKDKVILEPSDILIKQNSTGLYLVDNGVVRCRYLMGITSQHERISQGFIASGKIESCPLNLGQDNTLDLPPTSFITTVQGDEWKYNAKDFKIINKTNADGSGNSTYGGDVRAAARFVLDNLDSLSKKYNIKPVARVVDFKDVEKLKKLFPLWTFFDFNQGDNEILWGNLGQSVVVVNRQKKVVGNFLVFGGLESIGNTIAFESALRKARR
jgi:hypothetical protein